MELSALSKWPGRIRVGQMSCGDLLMMYGGIIFTLKLAREDKGWSFDRRKFTYGFLYGGIIYTLKVTREDKGWSYAR